MESLMRPWAGLLATLQKEGKEGQGKYGETGVVVEEMRRPDDG